MTSIVIPEGVTSIEGQAFDGCSNLTSISLPKTLTSIDKKAFSECSSLSSIEIPEGVTSIGNSAFSGCRALTSVSIPRTLTSINNSAFFGCSNLTKITIPESVKEIGESAFASCTTLDSIEIPEGVTSIGSYAFNNCKNLTSIEIPSSVTEIGAHAFDGCSNLTSIKLLGRVSSIENRAFYDCSSLTSIEIPEGVTSIGNGAFSECSSLSSIEVPEGVTSIGANAFNGCSGLTSVSLPSTLTSISNSAFSFCKKLTKITIPESVKEIGEDAFYGCSSLTSIEIPEGVTSIGNMAFNGCSALTSVSLPSTLTSISNFAFFECSGLTSIKIPSNVTEIGQYAFEYCDNLTRINYGDLVFNKNSEGFWTAEYYRKTIKIKNNIDDAQFYNKIVFYKAAHDVGIENIPFVPHESVFKNIKKEDLKNFFSNSKTYAALQSEFAKFSKVEIKNINTESREDFFKICYISGLFSPSAKERESAEKFIRENIIGKFNQYELHSRFSGLETKKNGYHPKFAEFLKANYSPNFLITSNEDLEIDKLDFFSQAYNRFNEILEAFPNSEIKTNTDRDRLTADQVISFLEDNKYINIGKEGDSYLTEKCCELAKVVGRYGYSQTQFETLQNWFINGIKSGTKLSCEPDAQTNQITFELLSKDNPLGAVLGNVTNCCQKIGDAGESCAKHGMSDPNGGFVVFRVGKRIIGQAWVWYNKEKRKVCFDNIEVPNSAKDIVKKNYDEFISCLERASSSISESMSKNGNKVNLVTMGKGYNDILYLKHSDQFREATKEESNGAPAGYSDTSSGEVTIWKAVHTLVAAAINSANGSNYVPVRSSEQVC